MDTVTLTELCGGDIQAKTNLLAKINKLPIDETQHHVLLSAWNAGFDAYHDLMLEAVRSGRIMIIANDDDGEPTWQFVPL